MTPYNPNSADWTQADACRTSPTGLSAATMIGRYVSIGQGCVLRSVTIGDEVVVGDKCAMSRSKTAEAVSCESSKPCIIQQARIIVTRLLHAASQNL